MRRSRTAFPSGTRSAAHAEDGPRERYRKCGTPARNKARGRAEGDIQRDDLPGHPVVAENGAYMVTVARRRSSRVDRGCGDDEMDLTRRDCGRRQLPPVRRLSMEWWRGSMWPVARPQQESVCLSLIRIVSASGWSMSVRMVRACCQ